MSKGNMEQQLIADIDAYMSGQSVLELPESEDYNTLLELGKTLVDTNYSSSSNKDDVRRRAWLASHQSEEGRRVRKSSKGRGLAFAATALVMILSSVLFVRPSLASELFGRVLNTISLCHITA
ncbi:MAG: hypothetical protein K6T85_14070, partial [Gorillibacterium sp.]|nr:hypothetical protein [Gorillibacterium sp.]